MRRPVLLLISATALAGLALAGCGATGGTSAPTPTTTVSVPAAPAGTSAAPPSTAAVTITITNFAYVVPGSVAPGQKVMVHNEDNVAHTVTADSGSVFDLNVPPSATATFTAPNHPGSYPFHCTYHANMHATLAVR